MSSASGAAAVPPISKVPLDAPRSVVQGRRGLSRATAVALGIVTLLVFLTLIHGLTIGVLTALAAVPLGASLLAPGGRAAATLVYTYVLCVLIGGVIALPMLVSNDTNGLSSIVLGYVVFLLSYAAVAFPRSHGGAARLGRRPGRLVLHRDRLLIAFTISFVVGGLGWVLIVGGTFDLRSFTADPQAARSSITEVPPSPYVWTAFRMLIIAGMLAYAWSAMARGRSARWLALGVAGIAFLLLLSYGGRLLPASMLLGVIVFRHMTLRPIPVRRLFILAVLFLVVATWYSGYRYYAFFGRPFTSDAYVTTLARQVGGDVTDATQVAGLYGLNQPDVRRVLAEQLTNSVPLPASIQSSSTPESGYSGFGAFVSDALDQSHVGGLRVGAPGEAVLGFGLLGSVAFGLIFGGFARLADRLLASPSLWICAAGAFLLGQLLFVIITGSSNFVSAITAVAVGAILLKLGLGGRPEAVAPRDEPTGPLPPPGVAEA